MSAFKKTKSYSITEEDYKLLMEFCSSILFADTKKKPEGRFVNANLAFADLCCERDPADKMLMELLDSIGGYFEACHKMKEKYPEDYSPTMVEDACALMKIAIKLETQMNIKNHPLKIVASRGILE